MRRPVASTSTVGSKVVTSGAGVLVGAAVAAGAGAVCVSDQQAPALQFPTAQYSALVPQY